MNRIILLTLLYLTGLTGFCQKNPEITNPLKPSSIFPEEIRGNWFRTDGSRDWVYGFYDQVVIYGGEVFDKFGISQKGKQYRVAFRKNGMEQVCYIKPVSKGNLRIGRDQDNLELLSHEPVSKSDYVFPDNEEFHSPVIRRDTAVCKGYLNGYIPKPREKGMVIVTNILANEDDSLPVTIAGNGSFEVKVPMDYPQEVTLVFSGRYRKIFLEPGKTTFFFLDVSGSSPATSNKKPLFMGDGGRINADLQKISGIGLFDFNAFMSNTRKMSRVEYKDWCLGVMKRELDSLSRFAETFPVCKKALQVKRLVILYRTYENILMYEVNREIFTQAFDKKTVEPIAKSDSSFYSFLHVDELNNPVSLVAGEAYYGFIDGIDQVISSFSNYEDMIRNLRNSLGLSPGLVSEIMYYRFLTSYILNGEMRPFNQTEISTIKSEIQTPFISDNLLIESKILYDRNEELRLANESKTGYFIEAPKVTGDQLFEAIIGQYPGKVIFIDFWATWCSPCKAGIERMKPVKEEYRDKDLVFIYITDQSSPLSTWNLLIPGIRGHHYRLGQAEYKNLHKRFNIRTIPRYMLIDKSGKLINDNLGDIAHSNEELKKLFDEYLKK